MVEAADLIAFYSYASGVSLELPVGFEQASEDDRSVTYTDDTTDPATTVQVRVVATGDAASALSRLVDGFAAAADGDVRARHQLTVDDAPGETVVVRRADGSVLYQTGLADEDRLIAVTGAGPDSAVPVFDAAVASIRFVTL